MTTNPTFPTLDKPEWAMSPREMAAAQRARAGLPRRRRLWPWLVALLVVLAVGGYAWWWQSRPAPPAAPEVAVVSRMQVNPDEYATLAPQTLRRTVKVIGTLEPARRAQLSSQTGGQVEAVTARPGDAVAAGDMLVQVGIERLTLDLNLQRSNADATRAQLALAEGQLQRVQALLDRGVSTASSQEEARSSVEGLRATVSALADQVLAAELTLRNATVRAPFGGIVSARAVEPGTFVSVGAPLISLVDLSRVEMQGNAPISAGSLLRPGQDVTVTVDGIAGRSFAGSVARINPVAAEGTRTIQVYVTIDNAEGLLLGGMFATGQIVVAEAKDALAIPTDALRTDRAGKHVLKIDGDVLVRQPVEAGGEWAGRLTEIRSGIAAGDIVVTAALPELTPGDTIRLLEN
ncbi:efflux RND transporter periplasmic adaptor subunit [Paracoccaceae bacterium Fryx2]|nr:efflux RND transporter periplasmic adaptor subunit [Paracoccaceae bacterium Fryx2]